MPVHSLSHGHRRSRLFTTSAFGALALAAIWAAPAHAQLVQTGASGNGGAPVVDQSVPGATTVTLNGSRAVIDWSQFDINSGERADFIFVDRNDIVLNRVGGAAGSTINGDLNGVIGAGGPAGGNIWIYNANGVVIGANARINTGGLLVTTAALDRADDATPGGFLDGTSTSFGFTGGATGSAIAVRNGAQVNSFGGAIALVAPVVTTEAGSSIAAQNGGNVLIGSAAKYKIHFRPTSTDDFDLLSFEVASGADGAGNSAESIDLGGDVSGNRVFVAAVSKTGLAASILSSGTITATNVATDETGAIVLSANHNIVNGAVEAAPVFGGIGTGFVTTFGGALTAPAVTIAASEGVMLRGDVNAAGGTVDVRSDNGDIRQFAGVITAGRVSASAHSGINFNSFSANRVDQLGDLTTDTGDLSYIGDEDTLELTGVIRAPGKVTLGARDFIDTTTGSITAGSLELFLGGGGAFKVDGDANLGNGLSNGAVTIQATGNITLANEFNLAFGDQLTLTAGDAIGQTAGFVSGGGAVAATAVNGIDLGQANQVSQFTATSSGGAGVNLRAVSTFGIVGGGTSGTLSAVSDTGNITGTGIDVGRLTASAAGGNIDFSANTNAIRGLGNVTGWGAVSVSTTTGLAVEGNVQGPTVALHANGGDLTQAAGSTIRGHALTITASGSILQDAGAVMRGTGFVSSVVQAGDDLILAGSNRLADYADVTLGWGAGSDVTYHSAYSIFFQPTGTSIGALNLIVDNGSIQQGGAFTANSFSASASGDIDIGSAANNSIARLGNISSSTGEVRLRVGTNNPLAIDGTISSTSRVIFTAQGAVSGSGKFAAPGLYLGLIGGGTVNVAGSTNLLELGVSNGDATVRADDSLTLSGTVALNNRHIALIAGAGSITQTGGSIVGTGMLSATAAGDISLSAANNFNNVEATSTGAGLITLNAIGNLDFKARTASSVRVTTGGDATASGANAINAGALDITAGGRIDLDFTGGGAAFGQLSAGGDVLIAMDGDVVLGGNVTAGGGGTASLRSRGGAISQSAGTIDATSIALGANTTISQGSGATLHSTNLSLSSGGHATLGEANDFTTLTDLAVGGDLTLRNLGNINLSPILGGTGGYRSGGALTLVSDTGNILSTNSGTSTSRLNASAAGSISLDGTIASLGTITAGQSILLTTYNGSMDLTGNVTGRNISLYGYTGLSQSGGIIDADRLNVITNGNISLTGANRIDVVGRLDTDQSDSGTGHDITLRNVGAIVLDYQIEAPDGTVTLTSDTGGISQTSFSSLFTARTLKASAAGDILLDYAGNNIGRVTGLQTSSGNITFNEANGFDIYGDITTPGSVSLSSGGAIETYSGHLSADMLSVTAGGDVSFNAIGNIKLGAVDTSGAGVTPGGNFFLSTDGDIALTGAVTTGDRNLILDTTGGAITANGGTVSANYNGSTGVIYATADGGIDLASVGSAVIWATSANGGNVNLTSDADIGFMVNTTGDLTVNAGGFAANNGDLIARSVGITAGTGIVLYDQTVNIDVGSYRTLTVADGYIDIENKGDINLDGDVTTGGLGNGNTIRLNSTTGSILQNSGTIGADYSVELKAAGSIIQDAAASVITGGVGGFSFTGTDVTLLGANEIGAISMYSVSRDLTLRTVGTLDMGATGNQAATYGDLTLISDTGDINGFAIKASKLTASAVNGSINFGYSGNAINALGDMIARSTSGADIKVDSGNPLELTGNITAGGVQLFSYGTITQTGGRIVADRLDAYSLGDLDLGGANDFGALINFNGANVRLRNRGDIALPGNSTNFGTLDLTSDQGSISQTNALRATTLIVRAATGITLNDAGNNFGTLDGLTTAAGDIRIADTGGFAIEGDIAAATGIVALASTGNITTGTTIAGPVMTPHGKVDADTLTVSAVNATVYAAGDIKLGASAVSSGFTLSADGSIDLTATSNFNGASLIATAGSITQSGGILTGNTVLTGASGSITLDKNNNLTDFGGTSTGGGNVTFNNVGASALSLSLSTTGNAVVTTAGDVLGTYIHVNDLSLTAGSIDLRTQVGVNSFSKLAAAYGDVLVTNNGSFSIAGDVSTNRPGLRTIDLRANGGGILHTAGTISGHYASLRGTGDLIQSGTARVDANAAYFSGANLLLGGANNLVSNDTRIAATGNLTLRNAGSIDLTVMGGYTAGGALSLTSDTGSITATGAVTASALTALAANGAVSFSHADNLISELRRLGAGANATLRSRNGGFTLTGDFDVGGTLSLHAGTGINQTGGRIRATTLDAQLYQTMTTGSVLLGGANDVDNLYVLAASGAGDVLFRDTDGFRVTYAVIGNRVTLASDAGAITQASGYMDGVQASQLTVSAVDGISLNNEWNGIRTILGLTNTGSGGIDVGGRGVNMVLDGNVTAAGQTVSLTALNASLTQTSGSIVADTLNASAGTGVVLDKANAIARLGTLTNATSGGIRVNDATGDLDLAGPVTATGQAVRFDTAGRFTQSAALGAYSNLTINAGTGLILDQANNFGATTLSLATASGDITVRNVGNLTLPALTAAGGTIRLISDTGTIGQTGVFTANTLFASARREISLGGSNVITNVGGLVNTSGTITFRDIDGFNITGDIRGSTTTGERVNLTAGGMGDIVQTGGAIVVDKLRATAGGNLTLDGSANAFINVEVLSAGGDIRLRAQDSFVLGHTVDAGGTATLTSTNGFIGTDLGSIGHVRADALYVNAATGIDINLPGNITPKVSLVTATGNIRYTSQGALEFLALKTPDRAIVSADALTQSGAIDVGALDALAGDIRLDMAGNRIGSIYAAMATGGDLFITDEDGFDIAGNLQASGTISLAAGGTGSITQSGGIITAPTVSLVAAGGNITLDGANAVGVYNARSAIGGTITLRNAGDLTVNAITAQNGTVNLTSNTGSVGQLLVPGNSIWAGKLNANAATDIDLAAQNFTGLLGNLTAGGSIRYNSFHTLGLDGDIRAGGGVTFGISGYLGQYSGTVTASHLDVTATGVALIGANDIGSAAASNFSATDDITFRSINSILLGSVTTPGLLSLTSDGGDIGQTAAFSAGRFDAIAAGDIVLDQLNTLDTVNDVTAGGVFSLRTNGALELDGRIAADDRVTFDTGGGLTQIGNTVIVTDRLEATAGTATATGIRLLNHNRVGAVSLDAGGNDIRFRNTGNIAIGAINSPAGTVELISNLGKITQQAGGGLVAGSLILNAANGVELYNSDNQIARLDVVSRGDVSISTGGSGWGGLLTVDRIDAAGKAVSVANYVAGMTGGNITAATLTVFSAGDTDLGTINDITGNVGLSGRNIIFTNRGNLVLDRVLSSLGNAVLRSEEGAISQTSGSALFDTTGLTAYGRDGVTIAGGVRRIDGLSAGAGADVEVVTSRPLELAGDISARNVLLRSNASPNVLDPTGGAITQTGGVITADLFRSSAYGAIDLGLGNQIAALGDVWSFTGGISIASDRALDLTGALTAIGGDVVLDAASIGQSGGYIEAAGLRARTTGTIGLDMANRIAATGTVTFDAGADIAFRNDGGFTLGMVDTPGAVTLTSLNGSIGQTVSTRIGASRLSVSAENGGIALDEANLVDTLGGLTAGGDVIFRNVGDFALDGDIAAAGREVALRSNTGTIGQTSGTITALGLDVDANGAITLGSANNVTNLRNMLSGGDILFRNAGALMLWGDVTGDEVTLGTDGGSLLQMLFTGGIITANRLNASAGGALNFNHANRVTELGDYASGAGVVGFTNDGSLALAGDISGDQLFLRSLTGGITQSAGRIDAGSIDASAAGSILLDRANQVAADGPVRLVSTSGDVTFRALGGFTLDFGAAAGTFDVTSDNGSIGQSGAVTANRLNARAGGSIALTSDNAVTNLGRLVAGMAGDIAFSAAGDLLLTDAIDAGGTVTLVADVGEITQGGGASITAAALSVSAARDIVLGEANAVGAFAGASAAGDMLFRNAGDVSLGAISSSGTLTITSDAGAVTQDGDLSAGTLTVWAQNGIVLTRSGNMVAGQVNLANLGAGGIAYTESGNLLIGSIGAAGQVVSLIAGGDIGEVAGVEATTLNLTATGDVTLSQSAGNRIGALGTVAIANGNFALENAGALNLGDTIDIGRGTVDIRAGGAIVQNGGIIIADRLTGAAAGDFRLGAANRIGALGAFDAGGAILVTNSGALDIDGAVSATANVSLRAHGGMTINAGGSIASGAAGDAIVLASDGVFRNFGGANALSAANGRWLVYSQTAGHAGASDPGNDFGGLAGKSYYGAAFDFGNGTFAVAPGAGNRFVYGYRPVLTVRPDDIAMTYNGQTPTLTSTISGLVNGDSVGDAWSGAALLSGAARNAGTYVLGAAQGTLASDMNYDFAFDTGTLRIDPRAIVAALTANDRIYDGTTNATGALGLSGLIAGDDVAASAILAFDSRNAGTRTATASGIVLTGADADNYVVNATATDLATIGARAILAALTADDRIYDGTTNATGVLGLSGLVAGDDVAASAILAFDSRNAGTRTATASGIVLTGADADNYVVNATATDLATIGARAILAALTADDRIYDGTTNATGVLGLSGLVAGDDVGANALLAFDSRNAGTRTATASGIVLTGADADNYVVNATATDLATIGARAIIAALTANDRIYDGTTNATGTLGLSGVLGGDEVGVSGRLAFDSRNAGSRVVTASGLALTGADAGNYTVDSSVTDAATIARLAITATATADSRLYDGTTGATGRIALNGVIAGDDLSATARFGFADANAGSGRAVTVSDFGVGGADAGNYIVTLAPGPIVADILRRAVSVSVDNLSKIFGQPDPALTYRIMSGSLVPADAFSGSLVRSPGEEAGSYAITQGTLALSDNYLLTVTPGRLTIGFARSIADASDALRLLRVDDLGFRLDRDPSANLLGE